jgi:DNA methylase
MGQRVEDLPVIWRAAPRRWGHSLHSLCSYFAMFPPRVPRVFIEWLTDPGDTVYDPFSGRGTTSLEAALSGRRAFAADLNPLGALLSGAKLEVPSRQSIADRLSDLERSFSPTGEQAPDEIRMLYSQPVLTQLLFLRSQLSLKERVDRFITAVLMGLMHANHSEGGATRGLSISMPNTFAMSPKYVRAFIRDHELIAPEVDVFEVLRSRIQHFHLPTQGWTHGKAWRRDATRPPPRQLEGRVRLVFTSPPYLDVIKYGKYNWVRLWFLGHASKEVDAALMTSGSRSRYMAFMTSTLLQLEQVLAPDGVLCLVVGDVRRGTSEVRLAEDVWAEVAEPAGWKRLASIPDELPTRHKVSRIWADNRVRATKVDRFLILSRSPRVKLPSFPSIDWGSLDTGIGG